MDLHAGDLDSLTDLFQSLFSPAVSHFLHSLSEKRPDKERKMLPPLADVHALPASGLGRLMVSLTLLQNTSSASLLSFSQGFAMQVCMLLKLPDQGLQPTRPMRACRIGSCTHKFNWLPTSRSSRKLEYTSCRSASPTFGITPPLPITSSQCRNVFLLSPGVSEYKISSVRMMFLNLK